MTRSVVEMIATSVSAYLNAQMKDIVESDDASRAGLVRVGLLQQSPLTAKVNVLVNYNDPDEEKSWYHSIVSSPGENPVGLSIPAYEVGGGEMWFRRYTLKMDQFFATSADRVLAEALAQVILSRAEESLRHVPLIDADTGESLADNFGEIALKLFLHSSQNVEGGGPGQFIFHGKVWFQVLTEKTRL